MVKLVSIENSRGGLVVTESCDTPTEAGEFYQVLCSMKQIEMLEYSYDSDGNFKLRYWTSAE